MAPLIERHRSGTGERAGTDALFFAQVREDAQLELDALKHVLDGEIAVVSSGGCTALAVLGSGAEVVHSVDLNTTQNHVVEIKAVAIAQLQGDELLGFLGARPMDAATRERLYQRIAPQLSRSAALWCQENPQAIRDGLLHAGKTEKFVAGVMKLARTTALKPGTFEALLAADSLDEQRRIFDSRWDTRRWRAALETVCHRRIFDRVYTEEFFANTGSTSFADHFGQVFRHTLTELPIATNPYVHDILTGQFGDALPPWLEPTILDGTRGNLQGLQIWDAPMGEWLATRDDHSLAGVTLSNICEWLTAAETERLFAELGRVVRPGGVVVLRNFVGWTTIPESGNRFFTIDPASETMVERDRSMMQSRVVVLVAREAPLPVDPITVRALGPDDSQALRRLAWSNPIKSSTHYIVDRSDFAPMADSIPGAVMLGAEDSLGLVGAATVLPFAATVGEHNVDVCYLGGIVAEPRRTGAGAHVGLAALEHWRQLGSDVIIWLTNNDNERVARAAGRHQPDDVEVIAEVAYTEVMPQRRATTKTGWRLAAITPEALDSALAMVNAGLADRTLYAPLTRESLLQLPGSSMADLLGLYDEAGDLRAVAQVRDPMAHARVVPIRFDAMTKMFERGVNALRKVGAGLPEPPHENEPLRTLQVRRAVFSDEQAGKELMRHLGNLALSRGVHSLSYVDDPRAPLPRAHLLVFTYPGRISGTTRDDSTLTIAELRERPLFADVSLT